MPGFSEQSFWLGPLFSYIVSFLYKKMYIFLNFFNAHTRSFLWGSNLHFELYLLFI